MGMFDKPNFLTGDDGFVEPGDTFWLHAAKIDGMTNGPNGQRESVKLRVSRERDGETEDVFTSGKGIAMQVRRMSAEDRAAMPIEVRLDQIPPKVQGNNPTNVLTPANLPPAAARQSDGKPADF